MNITTNLRVCVDCAMVIANGDTSGIDEGYDGERVAAVLDSVKALGPGLCVGDHVGFSWSGCDCCGSQLGGDRFDAIILG